MSVFFVVLGSVILQAQRVLDPQFEKRLEELIEYKVPVLTVMQVCDRLSTFQILDTREKKEYNISHIPGAIYVGYDDFDLSDLQLEKDKPILVYCSVGYRSDIIGGKLDRAGYTNVYNLYGSIFEWANHGFQLEDADGATTRQLHTYNRKWSRWVSHPDVEKVW